MLIIIGNVFASCFESLKAQKDRSVLVGASAVPRQHTVPAVAPLLWRLFLRSLQGLCPAVPAYSQQLHTLKKLCTLHAPGPLLQAHDIQRSSLFIQTKYTPIGGQDRSQPLPYDPAAPLAEQVCLCVMW